MITTFVSVNLQGANIQLVYYDIGFIYDSFVTTIAAGGRDIASVLLTRFR